METSKFLKTTPESMAERFFLVYLKQNNTRSFGKGEGDFKTYKENYYRQKKLA
jgi:hypothetical protein